MSSPEEQWTAWQTEKTDCGQCKCGGKLLVMQFGLGLIDLRERRVKLRLRLPPAGPLCKERHLVLETHHTVV
ncbi:hypothetical protein STEG23_013378, partial [Scotinomys teguina]